MGASADAELTRYMAFSGEGVRRGVACSLGDIDVGDTSVAWGSVVGSGVLFTGWGDVASVV